MSSGTRLAQSNPHYDLSGFLRGIRMQTGRLMHQRRSFSSTSQGLVVVAMRVNWGKG